MTDPTSTAPRRRRRALLAGLALTAVALVLAACGSDSSQLTGKTWQLTAITETTPAFQGVVPSADQTKYTITFNTDGTFNAVADCNLVSGTYKTNRSNLTLILGPSTLVACPEGSYGDLFVHALDRSETYKVDNDVLTITLKGGGSLSFTISLSPSPSASAAAVASPTATPTAKPTPSPTPKPTPTPTAKPTASPTAAPSNAPTQAPTAKPTAAPTASPAPTPAPSPGSDLTGKTWQLTAITLKVPAFQGQVPPAEQANYTVEFKNDGTFAAKADCNQVIGSWTATASGGLTVTPGPSTIVACADGSLSDLYVLGLSNAASYAVANAQLTITTADQGTLVYK